MAEHYKPAEIYDRPPEIEAELAALPPPAAPDYRDSMWSASLETVVIARRSAAGALQRQIDTILAELAMPLIRGAAARHGASPGSESEEVEGAAMLLFWEAMQHESFFEVRFNRALMFLARHAGKQVRGGMQRARERSALRFDATEQDALDGGGGPVDIADSVDVYAQVDARMEVEVGLAAIDRRQAEALILHDLMGYPVYSRYPGIPTVASLLGCSERTARRLLADGKAAWRREFGEDDDGDG